jgi:hypothetical protein
MIIPESIVIPSAVDCKKANVKTENDKEAKGGKFMGGSVPTTPSTCQAKRSKTINVNVDPMVVVGEVKYKIYRGKFLTFEEVESVYNNMQNRK